MFKYETLMTNIVEWIVVITNITAVIFN